MLRATFVHASLALLGTGGLDVRATPAGAPIRVLVSGDRRGEVPRALGDGGFTFAGSSYRGTPSIVPLGGGREGIVATLDVDAYLTGVVPLEVSPAWPAGALEAQAIVARTYALAKRTLSRPYDVIDAQSDQRWGGIAAEHPATNAAVAATRGVVLTYGGGMASVFYAACCGGHTADAAEIWGHAALPYLRGVADPYCTPAPDYRWERRVALERIAAALPPPPLGEIRAFGIGRAASDGRPLSIDVVGTAGRTTIPTADFRRAVGADVIRSTWIRRIAIDPSQADATIEGSGRGHGVGFCQWGARFMSAGGAAASEILAFYFPGTRLAGG